MLLVGNIGSFLPTLLVSMCKYELNLNRMEMKMGSIALLGRFYVSRGFLFIGFYSRFMSIFILFSRVLRSIKYVRFYLWFAN